MSARRNEQKNKILNQLGEMFSARLPQSDLTPVLDFTHQYYRVSPLEELAERSIDNLYGRRCRAGSICRSGMAVSPRFMCLTRIWSVMAGTVVIQ